MAQRRDKRPKALNPNLEPVDVFWLDMGMSQSEAFTPVFPRDTSIPESASLANSQDSNEDPFSSLLIWLGTA
jgi:hypothetical protein